MQIRKHKVVSIDYKLTDDSGQLIDTSEGAAPLSYLHGERNIIPGLENALEGKVTGDQVQVSIPPADGYGERRDELRQAVSRENFPQMDDLAVGQQFRVPTENNDELVVTIVEMDQDTVTIDANHALAGITLHFDVTIREVRDAAPDELAHGHVHATGSEHG